LNATLFSSTVEQVTTRFLKAEDVIGMLMIADLCNAELPIFVAADLNSVPGLYWSPGDVISANVDKLTTAVTLLPVITKVFEMVLLTVCEPVLESDPLHFGFKHNVGCNDAIFSLNSVIMYFNERGSSVFLASLDIKKAFDHVHHYIVTIYWCTTYYC